MCAVCTRRAVVLLNRYATLQTRCTCMAAVFVSGNWFGFDFRPNICHVWFRHGCMSSLAHQWNHHMKAGRAKMQLVLYRGHCPLFFGKTTYFWLRPKLLMIDTQETQWSTLAAGQGISSCKVVIFPLNIAGWNTRNLAPWNRLLCWWPQQSQK